MTDFKEFRQSVLDTIASLEALNPDFDTPEAEMLEALNSAEEEYREAERMARYKMACAVAATRGPKH